MTSGTTTATSGDEIAIKSGDTVRVPNGKLYRVSYVHNQSAAGPLVWWVMGRMLKNGKPWQGIKGFELSTVTKVDADGGAL